MITPGKTAVFECSHNSNPVITQVVWYRNSVPITKSTDKILIDNNNRLEIRGVTPSDAGRYECVGTNMAGKDSDTGILVVEGNLTNLRNKIFFAKFVFFQLRAAGQSGRTGLIAVALVLQPISSELANVAILFMAG